MGDGDPAASQPGRPPVAAGRVADELSRWLRLAASVAYTASTLDEAFHGALDVVCEQTGWPLGHAFRIDEATGRLLPVGIWHDDDPGRHRPFVEESAGVALTPGVGLPGRVMATGGPAWITDVRLDANFPRREAARRSGLAAGFGLPIVGSRGLEGVLEFFAHEPMEPDSELLDVLSHVGIHLGSVIERVRAQGALRTSESRLRTLVEGAPDALFLVDTTGSIVLVNAEAERLSGYGRDELLGLPVEVLVPEEARAAHQDDRRRFGAHPLRRGMALGRELSLRRRDGTMVPVDISLSPLDPPSAALVVASVRDVTERRRAEEAVRASEARLEEAEHLARIGSWSWDAETDTVTWSAELHRLYGLEPGQAPGAFPEYLALVHPDDRAGVQAAVEACVASRRPFEHEYRVLPAGGEERWVHARGAVVAHREGRPVRLAGFCRDVTEQRRAEDHRNRALRDLDDQHRILERIARGEAVGTTLDLLSADVERRCPGALVSVLLADPAEGVLRHAAAPSLPPAFCRALDGLPIDVAAGACGAAAATSTTVVVEDILTDPHTTAFVDLAQRFGLRAVWSHPLTDAAGQVLGTFAVYRPAPHVPGDDERRVVTAAGHLAALAIERHLSEQALARAAHIDPLTGLPNRARFLEHLAARLGDPDARLGVMFLDLDRFKWINDSLGHPAGDRVLVEVAARFERVLHEHHTVARFGGDEFTVLIEDATADRVATAADAVRKAFTEPFVLDGGEFFLTVSVGIARNDGGVDAYGLVRDADAAMYAAKEAGRDRHVLFDESLRERALARVTLESEIRRGIERDELVEDFQPIVDLATGRWAGAEALVRWHHPVRGLTGPDEFIPLAEETGLIVPLGGRVLEHAIAQAAAWAAAGVDLPVSVNVSVIQLADPMIARFVDLLLTHHEVAPDRVVVEVTESAVMERLDTARVALGQIAALGVPVVIDDFGTGYSSISRLGELPVVGVKIDRSFTGRLGGEDDRAGNVVAAITDLAHALGLYVVAEGIESAGALARLRALGCDFGQGFHLAPPMAADALTTAVREGAAPGDPSTSENADTRLIQRP